MKIIRFHQPRTSSLTPFVGSYGRAPLVAFEREFDRLFNAAANELLTLAPQLAGAGVGNGAPRVDLYEDKDNVFVRAELPGVDRKDINVELVEDHLTISGSRAATATSTGATNPDDTTPAARTEFSRAVTIPEAVQADKITAAYENGVLTVTLPKREEAKPRKISIEIK